MRPEIRSPDRRIPDSKIPDRETVPNLNPTAGRNSTPSSIPELLIENDYGWEEPTRVFGGAGRYFHRLAVLLADITWEDLRVEKDIHSILM